MTIAVFLKARIDEDEAAARAADPGPWEVGPSFGSRDSRVYIREEGSLMDWVGSTYVPSIFTSQVSNKTRFRENAAHIARHDPARVLAEVAAKRQIVQMAVNYSPELEQGDNGEWAFNEVLHLLADAYATHPDFDPSWRSGLYPTVGKP